MPYWSSSRVGIVPQGQPSKTKKRNERNNRKKGITMEDLKKQTALRLAQEQKEQQSRGSSQANSFPAPREQAKARLTSTTSNAVAPVSAAAAAVSPTALPPESPTFLRSPAPPQYASVNGSDTSSNTFQPRTPDNHVSRIPSFRYDQHSGHMMQRGGDGNGRQAPNRIITRSYSHEPARESHGSASSLSSSLAKSKLPHGLTVHELKEMTKARLQAEAAEKTEPLGPVPASLKASTEYREQPSRSTPTPTSGGGPPGFQSAAAAPQPISAFVDKNDFASRTAREWSQEPRADAWETASVSTATSDFYGSESAFSTGVNNISSNSCEETPANPFVPGRSFSANASFGSSHEPMPFETAPTLTIATTGSYFEPPSGFTPTQNRHRAATLSPRLGLSHLHEDRPFLPPQGIPGPPSFPSPSTQLTPRSRSAVLPESFRYSSTPTPLGVRPEANRGRTSSTTSLPGFSSTSDEFAVEPSGSRLPPNQFGILHEHAPSPTVTGLSNVFREAPGDLSAPPGFVGAADLRSNSGGLGGFEGVRDSRIRAATWSEPSNDRFGPALIGSSCEDCLADDLASILKLSGAEESTDASLFPPPGL